MDRSSFEFIFKTERKSFNFKERLFAETSLHAANVAF